MKKLNLLLTGLLFISAIFAFYPQLVDTLNLNPKKVCEPNNQFEKDVNAAKWENIINKSGTVNYFKDNFSAYKENSRVIDQFDTLSNLKIKGGFRGVNLSSDRISGNYALFFQTKPSENQNNALVVKRELKNPIDLSRWKESGVVSLWMNVENRKGISDIGLRLGDKNNNSRDYKNIRNFQLDIPNNYESDDVYPDLELATSVDKPKEWTDFWVNKGWNYLFWQVKPGNFQENGALDLKNITWFEIRLTAKNGISQQIMLDDLRIQDGIQKSANSLGGVWYSPDDKPQFGIFDLDQIDKNEYAVKIINVRETQYPTNGDHGRMVLSHNAPMNFSLRTRFQLTNLPQNKKERENSWFRVAYDFDPSYDPGHDWFGAFISLEWSKFGVTTVIPIEKDNIQTWEPKNESTVGSSVDFSPEKNTLYEIQITVKGQNTQATIYEVKNGCLITRGETNYTFQRPRYGEDKRYPFCLEVTGNLKANILEFEVKEL